MWQSIRIKALNSSTVLQRGEFPDKMPAMPGWPTYTVGSWRIQPVHDIMAAAYHKLWLWANHTLKFPTIIK